MRLLLDEHFPPRLARELRERGHDVSCVADAGLEGQPDEAVWAHAIEGGRVMVTYNRDDFLAVHNRHFVEGIHHPGLVLIAARTIPQHDIGALLRALEALLGSYGPLADQVVYLTR